MSCTDNEIDLFLQKIPSIPHVSLATDDLLSPMTVTEVEDAIKKLCLGKTPGSDGLTSEFYKHFCQDTSAILCDVFNAILDHGELSPSQKLTIIILLFKKGYKDQLENYRPISLTNIDNKILAYILVGRLSPHLESLISQNQTAYMLGCFIGNNIRSVQDLISNQEKTNPDGLILFWTFTRHLTLCLINFYLDFCDTLVSLMFLLTGSL